VSISNRKIKKSTSKYFIFPVLIAFVTVLVACHQEDDIDFEAPTVTVDSPAPGSDVTSLSVLISGTVSDDVVSVDITVDTTTTAATLAGTSYSGAVTLVPGVNPIRVTATDGVGNRNTQIFNLFYPQLAITDGAAATFVIGQSDFVSNSANQGSTAAANTVSGLLAPLHEYINTTLYLPDSGNNRILGYNSIPAASNASSNFVLGQGDFTATASGVSATQFSLPMGVYTTDTQLFLADSANNRVLIWDSHPTNNSVAANHVIGQLDFTSSAVGCSSSTLAAPSSVAVINDKVLVLDQGNHRVLIWNSIPTADGVAADIVIGQVGVSAMDTCLPNDSDGNGVTDTLSASTFNNPGAIWTDGTRLLVADTGNNRVLVWDTFPTTNGQAADWVIGQDDMVSAVTGLNNNSLNAPKSVTSNKNQIIVADSGNSRVLIFNSFPTANRPVADNVIGQPDFGTSTTGTSDTQMTSYDSVFVDRVRLFVVDGNRVLVWVNP